MMISPGPMEHYADSNDTLLHTQPACTNREKMPSYRYRYISCWHHIIPRFSRHTSLKGASQLLQPGCVVLVVCNSMINMFARGMSYYSVIAAEYPRKSLPISYSCLMWLSPFICFTISLCKSTEKRMNCHNQLVCANLMFTILNSSFLFINYYIVVSRFVNSLHLLLARLVWFYI